ncbi:MAG: T9SS C-terminal target domain-containing protein [Bacteroidetes bacterium]|nr:MAG: T9SS C-terminal target domain-containing protein [Bacteroidota bacterium]REK04885.1 MAG: T9SS C-terminal target domain-containing protein [Bacteroidota bacterium]REK36357.1 MAG: T9SS C-terminal target domain-containing protein [Bacteroidota bacterium]REK50977.1 MAG: T9SS C-terminal target domain-containing protein [Bacteroidota bacterium]
MKKILLFVFSLILAGPANSNWTGDVLVTSQLPQGRISFASDLLGTVFYASVPQTSLNPSYSLGIFESSNNGLSWTLRSLGGGMSGQVVKKSKLLVTGTGTVVCVFLAGNNIFTLDVMSGTQTAFTLLTADDFDAVASPNSNSIYLFVDEDGTNTIRRYSSGDAGITWGGSSALVTSGGAKPMVSMAGTRLVLTYYGPVLADTATSVIRTAYYNETGVATLTSVGGSFQDIVTNTSVRKKSFKPVYNGNVIWFFWTEGDLTSVLKCRISTNGGDNYGPEFLVAGTPTLSVSYPDAAFNPNTGEVQLCYHADSSQAAPPDPHTESIVFRTAASAAPSNFSSPLIINDYITEVPSVEYYPALGSFPSAAGGGAGIFWVQNGNSGPALFFDASNLVLGVNNLSDNSRVTSYPNPVKDFLYIDNKEMKFQTAELYDLNSRKLKSFELAKKSASIDMSDFTAGLYVLRLIDKDQSLIKKIVKE